ncbi:MAG: hypothetical protein ABI377_00495 [Devosia sp.]
MRTLGLLLLLLGALSYTLPIYRELVPIVIPIGSDDSRYIGATFVILGVIALIWSRR